MTIFKQQLSVFANNPPLFLSLSLSLYIYIYITNKIYNNYKIKSF